MGILNEMFSDNGGENEVQKREEVLLAKGQYKSEKETILSGYKTYQKKYIVKNLVLKLLLVVLALASSVIMLMSPDSKGAMPFFLIAICVVVGVYFISEPINNRKKLRNSLDEIEGTKYEAKITDRTITISTLNQVAPENQEAEDSTEVQTEETVETVNSDESEDKQESDEEKQDDEIPATVIHLDSPIVDFIDRNEMFIVCVKKSYVFIIPKAAFTEEEVQNTREKISAVMGIRFKVAD